MVISVIQFIHNGREPRPDSETGISWNRGDHRRRFLKCNGTYIGQNERKIQGPTVFWGEWEPESRVVKRIGKPIDNGPHYIYEPYYVRPSPYEERQNTDPFVFGDSFRYSICQQPSHPSLRTLEKGSLILFGSCVRKEFALDTVFVVFDYVHYSRQNREALFRQVDETYKIVTVNPILKGKGTACSKSCTRKVVSATYRSYRGATFDSKVNGMFSFFPCQAYTEDSSGFARPTIRMSEISDTLPRGIKRMKKCENLDEVTSYWKEVVKQVTRTCSLGIFAEMPKCESS